MTRDREHGLTLVEIVVALMLAAVVMALVGSLLVSSLSTWRRGRDLREAQTHAGILVEVIARDVRNASQAPSVVIKPQLAVDEGEPLLAITAPPQASPESAGNWILFVFYPDRQEVVRQVIVPGAAGRITVREERVVATGVVKVTMEPVAGGVTVEAEVRKGRSAAQARATATPRNP